MENTRVRDIMASPAQTMTPDTPVPTAIAMMKSYRIRHIPVVENGRLIGIVSRGDLREASTTAATNADSYELNFMLSRLPVSRVMTRRVLSITPDAFIVDAAEMMTQNKIACLPVVEQDGSVIGIVTDSDLLKLLARELRKSEQGQPEQSAA